MSDDTSRAQGIGIEDARRTLGEIVDRARYTGEITYLTRHGKPVAMIMPAGTYGADLTDADLARQHLGYGPGGHEDVDREFWRRFPTLHGWYQAADFLLTQHAEQWHEDNGGFNPMASDLPPALPAHADLMRDYRQMVQHIADGHRRHDDPVERR